MDKLTAFLHSNRDWAPLSLRLIAGWMLFAGAWSMALFVSPITGVVEFFKQLGIPVPSVSAYVAIYVQFICAILLILGLWVRQAALVLVFYFSVALLAAHTQDPITKSFPAWGLWAMSVCLSLTGAGKLAIDNRWKTTDKLIPYLLGFRNFCLLNERVRSLILLTKEIKQKFKHSIL